MCASKSVETWKWGTSIMETTSENWQNLP